MIKRLIKSLYLRNKELALEKSLKHCHVRGVHSIVLDENKDGKMIRLFYATPSHKLDTPVAFHCHKTDLTLFKIFGEIHHLLFTQNQRQEFKRYIFESAITGKGEFKSSGKQYKDVSLTALSPYQFLKGETYHSITVPAKEQAAWLVLEGEDNANYDHVVFSQQDLNKWTAENLYQKFDKLELQETIDFLTS